MIFGIVRSTFGGDSHKEIFGSVGAHLKKERASLKATQNAGSSVFETTLSGRTYIRLLKDLKRKGYTIHLFYLWVRDINLAIKRIEERVKMGGHDVPALVVRRRFNRGLDNLFHVYKPLLDSWTIFDNSTELPHVIVHEKKGVLTIVDDRLYELIRRSLRK